MGILINDPSFELELTGVGYWQLVGSPEFLATGSAYEGANVLSHQTLTDLFGGTSGTWGQQFFVPANEVNEPRVLRFWARPTVLVNESGWSYKVAVRTNAQFPPQGGTATSITIDAGSVVLDEWVEYSIEWTPTTTSYTLFVSASYGGAGSPISNLVFEFDSVTIYTVAEESILAKRRTILEAAKTTLSGITVANGYPVEVNDVFLGYREPQNVDNWPAIGLVYAEETKNTREMHRKQCVLRLHSIIYAEGDATYDGAYQCDLIAEAVEIILETKQSGAWLGLGYIEDLSIVRIDAFEVPEAVSRGRRVWNVEVQVTYHYDRLDP